MNNSHKTFEDYLYDKYNLTDLKENVFYRIPYDDFHYIKLYGVWYKLRESFYKVNHVVLMKEKITRNFRDYFVDYLNPTEEELVAFCLEHDIM